MEAASEVEPVPEPEPAPEPVDFTFGKVVDCHPTYRTTVIQVQSAVFEDAIHKVSGKLRAKKKAISEVMQRENVGSGGQGEALEEGRGI